MKLKTVSHLLVLALFGFTSRLQAADIPDSKDNPYVKRFNGAEIVAYKARNYDTLTFFEKDLTKPVVLEGQIIRIIYRVAPNKTSSLEVFRNYEGELKSKGFDILHSGSVQDLKCGNDFVQGEVQQGGFVADFWGGAFQNAYDISAIKHGPAGDIHLRVAVVEMTQSRGGVSPGEVGIIVDSLQVKGVTNKMVDGTASDMASQIAANGSVNLYGIYFDFNKSDIKPESKPTLDEVGKLLAGDASLKLKVVGHTDNVGTAKYNNELSLKRAQAVVNALVATYNIVTERLMPIGAGSTQPIASNDTDEGRAKNRRVELVKL
ncbi:MAG: OmpA family protein [Methylacidiphilales bacterium]|nr:OmpA family protein [Candidatus Methylacidiphilales bacterium]